MLHWISQVHKGKSLAQLPVTNWTVWSGDLLLFKPQLTPKWGDERDG